jgi:hypothetical protein
VDTRQSALPVYTYTVNDWTVRRIFMGLDTGLKFFIHDKKCNFDIFNLLKPSGFFKYRQA